jgi:hypothetical protein
MTARSTMQASIGFDWLPVLAGLAEYFAEGQNRSDGIAVTIGFFVAAVPTPLVDINGHAGADRNRSDMHVTVVDVPAIGAFGVPATGESGHALLKRGRAARTIRYLLGIGGSRGT